MEVTLAKCGVCGQYYQASEQHKCLLKPTQSNITNAINKAIEDIEKPQLIKPLFVESLEKEIRADERERLLSIVSRCIAHNVYNVSEGIALLNEIKEELEVNE